MHCWSCGAGLRHFPPIACDACNEWTWDNPKPGASAVVTADGEVLLVRRAQDPWAGGWEVPGGFCSGREHPMSAAIREVHEETGIAIEVTGMLGIWMDEYSTPRPGRPIENTLHIYYHAQPTGSRTPAPDPAEVLEAAWFPPQRLPAALAFPSRTGAVLASWRHIVAAGLSTTTYLPDAPSA